MRRFLFALLLCFCVSVGAAQQTGPEIIISATAIERINRVASVWGLVTSIGKGKDGTVYINYGQPYPHQHFTAIVPLSVVKEFGDVDWMKNRMISVTGKIFAKDGRAVMLIVNVNQIKDEEEGMRPRYPIAPDPE